MTPALPLGGHCLCGDVRFEIRGAPGPAGACHCESCRRWSGTYWSSVNIAQSDLVLTSGEASLAWYPSSEHAERGFCLLCGSSLFWRLSAADSERVAVAIGALDLPTGLDLSAHIFTGEAGDTYEVPQGAPHHEGFPQ